MHRITVVTTLALACAALAVAGCGSSSTSGSGSGGGSASKSSASGGSSSTSGGGYGHSSSSSTSTSSGAITVSTRHTKLGTILVSSDGHTLYLFEKDKTPKSRCTGACTSAWPPLTTQGKPQAGSGVKASLLSASVRPDGTTQVVYAGHPLYHYDDDHAAGQTEGQGRKEFGAEWYVLSASGHKVEGGEHHGKS